MSSGHRNLIISIHSHFESLGSFVIIILQSAFLYLLQLRTQRLSLIVCAARPSPTFCEKSKRRRKKEKHYRTTALARDNNSGKNIFIAQRYYFWQSLSLSFSPRSSSAAGDIRNTGSGSGNSSSARISTSKFYVFFYL